MRTLEGLDLWGSTTLLFYDDGGGFGLFIFLSRFLWLVRLWSVFGGLKISIYLCT